MGSVSSDAAEHSDTRSVPTAVKIVIAGGFGAGKTTMVGSVSEIRAMHTEAYMTDAGVGIDDVSGVLDKTTTTAQYANVGLFNSNVTPSGTGVTTGTVSGSGSAPSCSFPSYPAL